MKCSRCLLIAIVCLLGLNFHTHAQSLGYEKLNTVKIESISDEEIRVYYQKALKSGLSEDQVYQLLASKGLPDTEITKLRQRLVTISTGTGSSSAGNPSKIASDRNFERTVNADAGNVPMQVFRRDSIVFGSELFSANSMVFEPNLRIATPSNYILGPDDEVIINVYGYSEQTYKLTVNQEGNIYIPNVGPIFVSGLSMEQASAKIKGKLASTIYRNISSGSTNVQVTLGNIRSIHVTVIGEARKPGTYTVSSLTTLFNLLYLCGGPSEMGSYRNIELIRGNEIKRKVDIYSFLTKGDLKDNVLLQELDVIRIPYYQTRVTLSGEVKREGKFELQEGETLSNLLSYAGGFKDEAYKASVNITQLTDREKRIADVPAAAFNTYKPNGSDIVVVSKNLDRFANRVNITGGIFRPGNYELADGMSLKQLIEKAGGISENAFLQRGIISRQNADLSPVTVSFNVAGVMSGKEIINLKKEDFVTIGVRDNMIDKYNVTIEGEVHSPGSFQWRENISLKDLVFLANGFTELANPVNVEISRRVKDATVEDSLFHQSEVIIIDLKDGLANNGKDLLLQPFDMVSVRSLPGYVQQRSVTVAGEIMNAGKYVLKTNSDRISDLVHRFGGFKSGADSNALTLRRLVNTGISAEEKKQLFQRLLTVTEDSLNNNAALRSEINKKFDVISINLKELLKDPSSTANLLLEDGDYISVDRTSTLVRVAGDVYYPTLIPYHGGASMKYYLNRSGGFTENARKNSAMIIYPDGKAKTVSKFLFFRSYPSVTPRSEIFVPGKDKTNRNRFSTGEWVAISSIFATLGTLIITAFRK